jgi:hypothetical protein
VSLQSFYNPNNTLVLATNSSQVICGDRQCLSGAVGCMNHKQEKTFDDPVPTLHNHDYLDVKPVQIIWQDEEDLVIDDYSSTISNVEPERESNEVDHLHCVYPHFNDEIYR